MKILILGNSSIFKRKVYLGLKNFRNLEIEYFVRTTLERIVFITSGFYVFIVVNFLNNFNENKLR